MLFMSKKVSVPKISLLMQEMKIDPKSDIRHFCTKAFSYYSVSRKKELQVSKELLYCTGKSMFCYQLRTD